MSQPNREVLGMGGCFLLGDIHIPINRTHAGSYYDIPQTHLFH